MRTDGRDGRLAEFDIQYTFGVYRCSSTSLPFQMAEYSRSRSWDARAKKDGGQRLFQLYPTELVTHDVELHWTRPAQDWNFMCAAATQRASGRTTTRRPIDSARDGRKST